ncbi:MAG: peptidoglycan DD-metalloendopeptidase family protein [Candidatus Electrothrix sp. GW3-4]|uniref:M23 family metallopeptidase n=1 Tax=Candidatus Electrothrix sp. GW3-4 TaxID=3126740 RepID=UPI0030D301FC
MGFFQERNSLALKTTLQADALRELSENFDQHLKEQLAAQKNAWQAKEDAYHAEIQNLREEKEEVICRYEEEIASADISTAVKISGLLAELEQEKQEKQELLEKTAVRLDERSRMIESVMSRIGVDVKVGKKSTANSGGPFIAIDEKYSESLLNRSDKYIKTIRKMPLGYPMRGRITSGFGRRSDPINSRPAFHAGIDLKGRIGQNIKATADGIVTHSSYDKNGFGNFVILRHGNGYETVFGHMSKRLVKKGERIQRGQVVGLMGNTGRSTGPHLHYEVRYKGEPINPKKYLSVAKLSFTVPE